MSAMLMTNNLPNGFCYVDDPRIIVDMAYLTDNNFMGRPVRGYHKNVFIFTIAATKAIIAVQDELSTINKNYVLKVFDSYRPTSAVANFVEWSNDPTDIKMKESYYPTLEKPDLFRLGFIYATSKHSRGSTIDLTIVELDPQDPTKHTELEMGTIFDFFHNSSHTDSPLITGKARENRQLLKNLMDKHGFNNAPEEWWHYELRNEPFPDTYFDFPVA